MRSTIVAAAFAAGVLAVPHQKRDEVVQTVEDVAVVTDVVTVTGGQPAATADSSNNWPDWSKWSSTVSSTGAAPTTSQASSAESVWSSASTWTVSASAPTSDSNPPPSSTSSSSSAETSAAATGTGSAPSSYSDLAVYHHNLHRANHSAPDIAWDSDLESSAATIAASCIYAHNTDVDNGGYGQNIAAGVEANNISAIITDLFYNGEVGWFDGLYGQDSPDMSNFENWGHFSQIVWKGTTHVGCHTQDCSAQGLANTGGDVSPYFTVCNYKNPGNYGGEYGQNIGSPLNKPTAQWNTGS